MSPRPPDPASLLAMKQDSLPVTVLTGFLGSGKTTLLCHLLAQPEMAETAVIVNEFGEIGLDHHLIESATEDLLLLDSGCLCCSLRGDLVQTMRDLLDRLHRGEVPPFRRLFIETSGLADPAPILQTLMGDPLRFSRYRLRGVATTVDALLGEATLARHRDSVRQVAMADRLLITKTDVAETDVIEMLERRLRTLNPAASITPVTQGVIAPSELFAAGLPEHAARAADIQSWLGANRHHSHAHHHERNGITSFDLTFDDPIRWEPFHAAISNLITRHGESILRLKGLVDVEGLDQPVVIHGVQHIFHPPAQLDAWPNEDRKSRLVFITQSLDAEVVREHLRSCIGHMAA